MIRKVSLSTIQQQLSVATLLLIVSTLIIWAGTAVWQSSCHTSIFRFFPDTCPSLLVDLEPVLIALGFWIAALLIWIAGRPRLTSEFFLICALLPYTF